jgi:hypothetical protein
MGKSELQDIIGENTREYVAFMEMSRKAVAMQQAIIAQKYFNKAIKCSNENDRLLKALLRK